MIAISTLTQSSRKNNKGKSYKEHLLMIAKAVEGLEWKILGTKLKLPLKATQHFMHGSLNNFSSVISR